MNKHRIRRTLGCALMAAVSGTGLLAATGATAHAATTPSISATVGNDGNFHITGAGFTPRRTNVAVWLVDFTSNQTLFWRGDVGASAQNCGKMFCYLGGRVNIDGPTTYFPSDGVFTAHTAADIDLYTHCNHNVRAIAKDGDYNDPAAVWSNVSDNIAPACAVIN